MPVYTFACEPCKIDFEVLTIRAEWGRVRCPECGKKPKKTLAKTSFRVKGFSEKNSYGLKGKDVS